MPIQHVVNVVLIPRNVRIEWVPVKVNYDILANLYTRSHSPDPAPNTVRHSLTNDTVPFSWGHVNIWMARPLPGHPVALHSLTSMGYRPHVLRVSRLDVDLPEGMGAGWMTLGDVPSSPGTYLFTVTRNHVTHVVYAGLTKHLWMVTRGRLPSGESRGAQRYGRPKHAGQTRRHVNVLAAEQFRLGRVVAHWVRPFDSRPSVEDLYARLREEEEDLIVRWRLREVGWNRG